MSLRSRREKRATKKQGITKAVLSAIRMSKSAGLPYVEKKDIIDYVLKIIPDLEDADQKVAQALYHLQKNTKFKRQRVRKFSISKKKQVGWTVAYIDTIYTLDALPDNVEDIHLRIESV